MSRTITTPIPLWRSPLEALQTLDRTESVFYVGTFSKSLFPAIRLGFTVAPSWAQGALAAAKRCSDRHCAALAQDTLAAFIKEGHLARHVRRMRRIYGARRDLLLTGLREELGPWLEPMPAVAGLHVAAMGKGALGVAGSPLMSELVDAVRQREVRVYSVDRFRVGKPGSPRAGVRLWGPR